MFDELKIKGVNDNYNNISSDLIAAKLAEFRSVTTKSVQNTLGIFVSDVVNPINRLSIMLSFRFDRFFNDGTTNLVTSAVTGKYIQNSFSPKLGITYEIIENQLSVFANYNNGFRNIAPVMQPDGMVSVFKPQ